MAYETEKSTLELDVPEDVATVVARAQEGDQRARNDLARRYQRYVFTVALKTVGDFQTAQDLTQEVLIHALGKLGDLREPRAFAGWLAIIAKRMGINYLQRDRRRDVEYIDNMGDPVCDEPTPPDTLIEREEYSAMHDGIEHLGASDRRALDLFHMKECSLKQMAELLSNEEGRDVPLGTVKRRLHVARKRLKSLIEAA